MEGFAKRLHELRKRTAFSAEQIDKILGYEDRIECLENGMTEPTVEDIRMLAGFFCVSADYLLGIETNIKSIKLNNFLLPKNFEHEIIADNEGRIFKDGEKANNKFTAIALLLLAEALE